MNKKGQALVEFVLILPILIFIILIVIDIGRLMIMKNHLESLLGDIDVSTTSVLDKEYDVIFKRSEDDEKILIELKACLEVTTPGLSKILGEPACVTTSKYIEE